MTLTTDMCWRGIETYGSVRDKQRVDAVPFGAAPAVADEERDM